MATSAQEHLALINAVITKRLNGDAYQAYSEAEQRFEGTSLRDLYDLRDRLQQEANAAGGGSFGLLEPFDA